MSMSGKNSQTPSRWNGRTEARGSSSPRLRSGIFRRIVADGMAHAALTLKRAGARARLRLRIARPVVHGAAIPVLLALAVMNCAALNPIVQTLYTADPAPVVHDGVCYVYTSHDEDVLVNNFFTMKDWRCYSSTDMVNWTDHGAVASLHDFKWAGSGWGGGFENGAWAVQGIERDGRWYLYCPLHGRGIGVLVSTNGPFGPFTDPLGKPLIAGNHIDPAVFVDGDGQAYLTWGNPKCWYAKLNRDMISLDTSIGDKGLVAYDMTVEAFGKRSKADPDRATTFEEGPWLHQRNGLYYLFFAGGPLPEHLGYSTGPSPIGPWKYGGVVMPAQGGSFTDHPGVVDYKGKTYLFYHNGALPGGGGFHRSVCVEELKFNPDGSVIPVNMTKKGPPPIATLDPYQRVEAETLASSSGVKTAGNRTAGVYVTGISDGDYLKVGNVDFGRTGAARFIARVAGTNESGAIELRLDSATGAVVGTLKVKRTGGRDQWETQSCAVGGAKGVHDLILKFTGGGEPGFDFDWWKFE